MMKVLIKISQLNMQKVMFFGALAAAIYYFTFYNDGSQFDISLAAVNASITEQEAKKIESEAALKEEEKIRALVQQLSEQYKIISAQIPAEIQPFEILRTIDSMAATSGVVVKSKEPKKAEKKDIIEEIPIRIVAEGRFTELTLFLFNLMNTERISRLISFSMAPQTALMGDKGKSSSKLVLDLLLANYRFVGETKDAPEAGGQK